MGNTLLFDIVVSSKVPKYKQLINGIIAKIESGELQVGDKLPSINQVSFDYNLARDTIEKAYNHLKSKGVIEPVKGKGYYGKSSDHEWQFKVLILFNKLSTYKKEIYNAIAHELGAKANIDFFVYQRTPCCYPVFLPEYSRLTHIITDGKYP